MAASQAISPAEDPSKSHHQGCSCCCLKPHSAEVRLHRRPSDIACTVASRGSHSAQFPTRLVRPPVSRSAAGCARFQPRVRFAIRNQQQSDALAVAEESNAKRYALGVRKWGHAPAQARGRWDRRGLLETRARAAILGYYVEFPKGLGAGLQLRHRALVKTDGMVAPAS